jgi:hypothetical protein
VQLQPGLEVGLLLPIAADPEHARDHAADRALVVEHQV